MLMNQLFTQRPTLFQMAFRQFNRVSASAQMRKTVVSQKPMLENKAESASVMSIYDKINSVTTRKDGKVVHQYFKSSDGKARMFADENAFKSWKDNHLKAIQRDLKKKLSPHQYYITQQAGTERPFTGEYYDTQDLGMYSCVSCSQRIFLSEYKY